MTISRRVDARLDLVNAFARRVGSLGDDLRAHDDDPPPVIHDGSGCERWRCAHRSAYSCCNCALAFCCDCEARQPHDRSVVSEYRWCVSCQANPEDA